MRADMRNAGHTCASGSIKDRALPRPPAQHTRTSSDIEAMDVVEARVRKLRTTKSAADIAKIAKTVQRGGDSCKGVPGEQVLQGRVGKVAVRAVRPED